MAYGMTAFARSERATPVGNAVWEIRSVNHRFLETQFRLPDGYRDLEYTLREAARKMLKRGKVDCTLRINQEVVDTQLTVHRPTLQQLIAALQQVRTDLPEASPPDPIDVLRWPGVLGNEAGQDADAIKATLTAAFNEALTDLAAHRAREGAELKRVIGDRLADIHGIAAEMRDLSDGITAEIRDRLKRRLSELQTEVDPGRLEQEVALLAQRADIVEEIDRLELHIKEASKCLGGKGPHGRRLDFLTQELNREANTLGAKSIATASSKRAVDMKVFIEQIREQVQNLE